MASSLFGHESWEQLLGTLLRCIGLDWIIFSTGFTPGGGGSCSRRWRAIATILYTFHTGGKPREEKHLCGKGNGWGGARPNPAEQVGFGSLTPIPTPPSQCRAPCPRGVGPARERGNEGTVTSEWVVLWTRRTLDPGTRSWRL